MLYSVTIDESDVQVLSTALVELPYKISAPLIDKLNKQIAEQIGKNAEKEKVKEEK